MEPKRTVWEVKGGPKTITVAADSREEAIAEGVRLLAVPRSEVTAKRVVRKAVA